MSELRFQAVALRKRGMTYAEISSVLHHHVPKSTLSYWCKGIVLGDAYVRKVQHLTERNLMKARERSVIVRRVRERQLLDKLFHENAHLARRLEDVNVAKIALAILYWGEGGKRWRSGCLYFGNSDELMIKFYITLLRKCYQVDFSKFRCTVQCRADQDHEVLKQYWSKITGIPVEQFYKTQVDKRTIGKPTRGLDYRGVCRVDYLSVGLFKDIMQTIKVLAMGR